MADPTNAALLNRRRRAMIACTNCRKRKIKCVTSEEPPRNPCARCSKRSLTCEYVAVEIGEEYSPTPESPAAPLPPTLYPHSHSYLNHPGAQPPAGYSPYTPPYGQYPPPQPQHHMPNPAYPNPPRGSYGPPYGPGPSGNNPYGGPPAGYPAGNGQYTYQQPFLGAGPQNQWSQGSMHQQPRQAIGLPCSLLEVSADFPFPPDACALACASVAEERSKFFFHRPVAVRDYATYSFRLIPTIETPSHSVDCVP
ncbi:hypothetical protein C8R44DRAFT_732615 [Mycena epipterygia]|nr:hypothetical protein C8R44DRAFT_732615 [Mycena epipterygia]